MLKKLFCFQFFLIAEELSLQGEVKFISVPAFFYINGMKKK
jgi:hypothetical protein